MTGGLACGDNELIDVKPSHDMPVHALPVEAAFDRLQSRDAGLKSEEAAERLRQHGLNRLPGRHDLSPLRVALNQFRSPFIYLLLAAAVLSFAIDQHAEAAFIAAVVLMNACIGGWQEWQAENRAQGLRKLARGRIPVWRDGRLSLQDIENLVPGDIVQIESGMRIPADLRLIDARGLTADESRLTGESTPVEKRALHAVPPEASLADRTNMLFAGASIHRGRGRGLVVATGLHSEMGRLAQALQAPTTPTPLLRRMEVFSRQLGLAIIVLIAAIAGLELLRGSDMQAIFFIAIALAVSAIPEALPIATTVVLSISMRRMAARNVIVRHMPAVEGLGACTVIATDKTGTLTVNRLAIDAIWMPESDTAPAARLRPHDPRVATLSFAAARCSESHGKVPDHSGEEVGDAVDLAFLRLALRSNYDAVMEAVGHRGRIAYEPESRYAAAFHEDGGVLMAYAKGAPETILSLCAAEQWPTARRVAAEAAVQDLANAGYRVIAVAAGPVDRPEAEALQGLSLLGFAGLIDPLRPEAKDAVQAARSAGIRVVMITGDHPVTARAIGQQLALVQDLDDETIVTGSQLRVLSGNPAAFDIAVSKASIFARTEPLQKLAIVESLQRQGHVVAVTGDGINDAPALHAADIGVAMGQGGTDIAREAADLVLVDDNFASIIAGIEEGRAAYVNLRKVILHCVSTSGAGLMLMLLAAVFRLPLPLTAVQLLWLNLISNGIQDVALGFERPEPGLLQRRPMAGGGALLDRPMLEQMILSGATVAALTFSLYVVMLQWSGVPLATIQGIMLCLMLWCENAHVMNCRSETRSVFAIPLSANWLLIAGVVATQVLQIVVASLPVVGPLLRLDGVTVPQILLLGLPALVLTGAMELYKMRAATRAREHAASS